MENKTVLRLKIVTDDGTVMKHPHEFGKRVYYPDPDGYFDVSEKDIAEEKKKRNEKSASYSVMRKLGQVAYDAWRNAINIDAFGRPMEDFSQLPVSERKEWADVAFESCDHFKLEDKKE